MLLRFEDEPIRNDSYRVDFKAIVDAEREEFLDFDEISVHQYDELNDQWHEICYAFEAIKFLNSNELEHFKRLALIEAFQRRQLQ